MSKLSLMLKNITKLYICGGRIIQMNTQTNKIFINNFPKIISKISNTPHFDKMTNLQELHITHT